MNFITKCFQFLKVPYVKVSSAEEYFALPTSEREYYGLYKKPFSLPLEWISPSEKGWNYFDSEIKKQYPIQYFFREFLPSSDNPVVFCYKKWLVWPLRDFKWAFKLFFKPCFPRWRKVLPRYKYSDMTHVVVEANFAMLLDFYYEEAVDGIVNWEGDEIHKTFFDKLKEYVNWIENERKEKDNQLSESLTAASINKVYTAENKLDYNKTYEEYNNLEQQIKDKETEILKWIIDNRDFFWT